MHARQKEIIMDVLDATSHHSWVLVHAVWSAANEIYPMNARYNIIPEIAGS